MNESGGRNAKKMVHGKLIANYDERFNNWEIVWLSGLNRNETVQMMSARQAMFVRPSQGMI